MLKWLYSSPTESNMASSYILDSTGACIYQQDGIIGNMVDHTSMYQTDFLGGQ